MKYQPGWRPFGSRPILYLGDLRPPAADQKWVVCEFKDDGQFPFLMLGRVVTVRGRYTGGGKLVYCQLKR
jgi:hypothetical protein